MSLQDSPSLEDYSDGILTPSDPEKGKKGAWILIVLIGLVLLILVGVKFAQSGLPVEIARRGTLSGNAVNEAGQPIQVEVLVFKTDINVLSDENGYFVIENVPSGQQSVIVAYGSIAAEVDVMVDPGVEYSLGKVTVPTELLEFVDE
jgi:hypothetical protein